MRTEDIERFVNLPLTHNFLQVDLNTNDSAIGLFVKGVDYEEMKTKNIWRFLRKENFSKWNSLREIDLELTELMNGNLIVNIIIL